MTPKEKAQDLYSKVHANLIKTENESATEKIYRKTNARICALITVYEIIDELQTYSDIESTIIQHGCLVSVIDLIQYWRSVEAELNNL